MCWIWNIRRIGSTWCMDDEFHFRYAVLEDTRKTFMWKCLVASWKWSGSLGENKFKDVSFETHPDRCANYCCKIGWISYREKKLFRNIQRLVGKKGRGEDNAYQKVLFLTISSFPVETWGVVFRDLINIYGHGRYVVVDI